MSELRSLHLCNLANVAYGYCKLLEQADRTIKLRCHDLKHLMSQPEWDDLELKAEDFPNEWDFFDNTADLDGYRRPDWYRSVPIGSRHFQELPDSDGRGERSSWTTGWVELLAQVFGESPVTAPQPQDHLSKARFEYLVRESEKSGPDFAIDHEMLETYLPHAWWLREQAVDCDVVFSYILAPIYSLLTGDKPFVSVEIGTMRDIPFDGTPTGRLLALAYRLSPHVLITNPDVMRQAEELGVESYSFCPHPLDEDILRPSLHGEFRHELLEETGADHILFAPARQNWEIKRNDRYLRAFRGLTQDDGVKALLIIPGWGQEVERSQRLCRDLGIEERVRWIAPQSEALLVKYYRAADFVLDQFDLGVFGLTTPKAMACGAVVVTSYDPSLHEWCFDEHPPLVAATTEGEIRTALAELCRNREHRQRISEDARRWVEEHHSKKRIRSVLEEAMGIACQRHRTVSEVVRPRS